MDSNPATAKRAIVYIDGYNLYFGLRASTVKRPGYKKLPKKYYWLNVQKLSERIIKDNALVAVKYFTARIKGDPDKLNRQNAFLSAIQLYCPKLQIFEGKFLFKQLFCRDCRRFSYKTICPFCNGINKHPEEKMSDVNIATQMLKDAYENNFDIAYLISGDSDFVPPIQVIRAMMPPKKIGVGFPPSRGVSQELRLVADFTFQISLTAIRNSILPDVIRKPDGSELRIPPEWNQ